MKTTYIITVLAILALFTAACQKNNFDTGQNVLLQFSVDTVFFDTVFTQIGTATYGFKVYNRYDSPIEISRIALAKNTREYRLNIDGLSVNAAEDLVIAAKDSMYIFVEATINPHNADSILLVQDSIVFVTNGNTQDIDLIAYAQDIHLINAEILKTQTWTNDKPYVIYNSTRVDTGQTLTIEEGCRIYSHQGTQFQVFGNLIVNGSCEKPVLFTSDRTEKEYADIPGKWYGIVFVPGSTGSLTNVSVKNAIIGLHMGDLGKINNPVVTAHNLTVENMTYAAVFATGSSFTATNSIFANCGYYALALIQGGNYKFTHCTIANYWSRSNRSEPSVALNNVVEYKGDIYTAAMTAYFGNSIIYGGRETEVGFGFLEGSEYSYLFENCVLRLAPDFDISDETHYKNNLRPDSFKFKDVFDQYNYALDTLSVAKDAADILITNQQPDLLGSDLNCNCRTCDNMPDIGAIERVEE